MWGMYGQLGCGHEYSQAVVSNNKISCVTPVQRNLLCGHSRWVPCFIMNPGQPPGYLGIYPPYTNRMPKSKCSELIDVIKKCRRHMYVGECHESLNPKPCTSKCNLLLPCGHSCVNLCHEIVRETKISNSKEGTGLSISEIEENHKDGFYCPPCVKVVSEKLPCGHEIEVPCANKVAFIATYKCDQICNKKVICGHKCTKKCSEPCTPCLLVVKKKRPGVCPHEVYQECFEDGYDAHCEELVPAYPRSTCGHEVLVPCGKGRGRNFKPNKELLQICDAPCNSMLNCGHICEGICCQCLQGRFHVRCSKPCSNILPCGHLCLASCSEPCPPCQSECGNICVHRKCDLQCGDTCYDCEEPCDYKCFHGACSKLCFEVCDKDPCYERCTKGIPECGHQCVGFCGEPCPPYCFICNKDKLAEANLFGDPPEESDRYIFLPDCEHVIESTSMDGWMESRKDEEEITPIFCPLCRTIIRQLKRYSLLMYTNRNDILQIMSVTNGDEFENRKKRIFLLSTIHHNKNTNFESLKNYLLDFMIEKSKFCKAELDGVDQYWQFITATDKVLEEIRLKLPKNRWQHLENLYHDLFQHLEGRKIPLSKIEVNDFNREFIRVQHAVEIQKRHGKDASEAIKNFARQTRTREKFDKIYLHLLHPTPYTVEREQTFLENLKYYDQLLNINLNISEDEKMTILQAFGNQVGRWFKCKKGHVYIITECGGAIERGVCYECGEAIGGLQHRAENENVLATEMDGAEEPLYPNAVQVLDFKG